MAFKPKKDPKTTKTTKTEAPTTDEAPANVNPTTGEVYDFKPHQVSANQVSPYIELFIEKMEAADEVGPMEGLKKRLDWIALTQLTQMSDDVFLKVGKQYSIGSLQRELTRQRAMITNQRAILSAICNQLDIEIPGETTLIAPANTARRSTSTLSMVG